MANKVGGAAVSAAKWVGGTAYGIAHKAAQPFYMVYALLQAGYVGVYGAVTGDYFEPDWLSDLAKNAPQDPNDKAAWNRYLAEAELDNLKDGAIAVPTLGASKVLGPVADKVLCKVSGKGCFAAGTPARLNHGCIAVERVREGTALLTVEEDDPDGAMTTQPVARTFQRFAVIWELHVAGRAVRTTAEHPFYVRGRGWTPVAEIRPGDALRTGEPGWVRRERVVNTGRAETVYNFEVQGDHTYFVGDPITWAFSLWAHNYPAPAGAATQSAKKLVHYGSPRSAEELAQRAAAAEAQIGHHGVSVMLRNPPQTGPYGQAVAEEVSKVFQVIQTGANKAHHTVILPKPVTQAVADLFNSVFTWVP
jgi:hypothetical protein